MIIILFFIVFLVEIATDLYIPTLPMISESLRAADFVTQWTMSLHLLGFALGQPIYGPLSDRWGRGPILLSGFSIFVLACLGCALSPSIECLILFRFIQGFGASAAPVIALALLKEMYEKDTVSIQKIALLNSTMSLSPIFAPVMGGTIAIFTGWQGNFYLLFLIGSFLFPFLIFCGNRLKNRNLIPSNIPLHQLFKNRGVILNSLINACLVSIVWLFITETPFIFSQNYHITMIQYGFYQAFTVLGYVLGGCISHFMAKRTQEKRLIQVGLGVIIFTALCSFSLIQVVAIDVKTFVFLISLYESGLGIMRPALLNKLLNFYPAQKGGVSSLIGMFEMGISALSIFVFRMVPAKTLTSFISVMGGIILIVAVMFIIESKQRKKYPYMIP